MLKLIVPSKFFGKSKNNFYKYHLLILFSLVLLCCLYFNGKCNEVGYRILTEQTSSKQSDTFQTMGRQSDFRPNHRWVYYNYPYHFCGRLY